MKLKTTLLTVGIFISLFSAYSQCSITTPLIFLDGNDVTGQTMDICISDVKSLSGAAPDVTTETGQWQIVSGTSITGVSGPDEIHGTLIIASSGTTRIEWTITGNDPNCTPETRFVELTVHEEPIAEIIEVSAGNDPALDTCAGIDLEVETASIGVTDVASWTSTLVPTGGPIDWAISANDVSVGENTITYTVDNPGCEPVTDSEVINIEEIKSIGVFINNPSIYCSGSEVNFIATPINGGPFPTYEWSYTEDPNISGATTSNQLNLTNLQTSIGTVTVRMNSSLRCVDTPFAEATTTLQVVQGPSPNILTPDSVMCVTDPITIIAEDQANAGPTNYQWLRDGVAIAGENELMLTNVNNSGVYQLASDNGICSPVLSNSMFLNVRQIPEVNILTAENGVINSNSITNIGLEGSHTGLVSAWTSSSNLATIEDPTSLSTTMNLEWNHTLSVTFTSTDGPCVASETATVITDDPLGLNQVLSKSSSSFLNLEGLESYNELQLSIYNTQGQLVANETIESATRWSPDNLSTGTYVYRLVYGENKDQTRNGTLIVLD